MTTRPVNGGVQMLNLLQVQSFITVIETGGFHDAARRLGISQSTVSQHIRKLELDLGVSLAQRERGEIAPTGSGAVFLPYARRLLAGSERATQAIQHQSLVFTFSPRWFNATRVHRPKRLPWRCTSALTQTPWPA